MWVARLHQGEAHLIAGTCISTVRVGGEESAHTLAPLESYCRD